MPKKELGYICSECAEAKGATWPKGHMATWHTGECSQCGKTKSLCCWTDWAWADAKRNMSANMRREI